MSETEIYITRLLTDKPWGVARYAYTHKWGFRDGNGIEQQETFLSFADAVNARDNMRGAAHG